MDTRLGQMRSSKIAFEWTEKHFILCGIEQGIIKEPTVMVPNPIEPHRQLALTIYRMAHGCSFKVLKQANLKSSTS